MVAFHFGSLKQIQAGCFAMTLFAAVGPARAASETVVYTFETRASGAFPTSALIKVGDWLYGTTSQGGAPNKANCPQKVGCGTVFKVKKAGEMGRRLYSFTGGSDGAGPAAGLINVGGTLYGTTLFGGTGNCTGNKQPNGCGTVFSITQAGTESTLYSFQGGSDGANPDAALLDVDGTLYGTTVGGGASGKGTVFSITPAGTKSIVYSFESGSDGSYPEAALINVGGTLYGTTFGGGASGLGTVFSVTPSGTETTLYSFQGNKIDGYQPEAALINVGGTRYGTAPIGGTGGLGAVFSITLAGTETTLYSFKGGNDGALPKAALISAHGKFYGTTLVRGASNEGTVFSITPSGHETTLYSFQGGTDGAQPLAALINLHGTLYGTTTAGGANNGTVFAVTP